MPSMKKARARTKRGCFNLLHSVCGGEEKAHVHYTCPYCGEHWATWTYADYEKTLDLRTPLEKALTLATAREAVKPAAEIRREEIVADMEFVEPASFDWEDWDRGRLQLPAV